MPDPQVDLEGRPVAARPRPSTSAAYPMDSKDGTVPVALVGSGGGAEGSTSSRPGTRPGRRWDQGSSSAPAGTALPVGHREVSRAVGPVAGAGPPAIRGGGG